MPHPIMALDDPRIPDRSGNQKLFEVQNEQEEGVTPVVDVLRRCVEEP